MVALGVLMRKTYFMAQRPISSTIFVKITLIHVWQAKELELCWVMGHILPETPNIPICTQEQTKIETSTCFWPKYCVENGIKAIRITGALLILIPMIPTLNCMTPVWIMWIILKYSAFTTKTSTIQIIWSSTNKSAYKYNGATVVRTFLFRSPVVWIIETSGYLKCVKYCRTLHETDNPYNY